MKQCAVSAQTFEITSADRTFYQQLEVPEPTLCPEERLRRRLCFRNERSLHYRSCDASEKRILSLYRQNCPFTVVDNEYWWGDAWDGENYGRDFDFGRPFFEQFAELLCAVPKMARIQQGQNENSTFTNCAANNKDCYMIFSASGNQGCMHSRMLNWNTDCVDCMSVFHCELCYECIDCEHCYGCAFCESSKNCTESYFLRNCIGCSNCIGCTNLRNKQYWIFNEPHSREDYEKYLESLDLSSHKVLCEAKEAFEGLFRSEPKPSIEVTNAENATGNYVRNSKDAYQCFQVSNVEECRYCDHLTNARRCCDVSFFGVSETNELLYECEAVGHGALRIAFSKLIWGGSSDVLYSYECFASSNLFGCSGLKRREYCILNKQYSKDDYTALRSRIIQHMKHTGEWGEFFPMRMSPFAYNESLAGELLPLSEKEVLSRGLKWTTARSTDGKQIYRLPDALCDTSNDAAGKTLLCEATGKPYRIEKQELAFHRKQGLALPRICPAERNKRRFSILGLPSDRKRKCNRCGETIQSAFDESRSPNVVCTECFSLMAD